MLDKEKTQQSSYDMSYLNCYHSHEDEIDLIELWNILWKRRFFIIGFTVVCTIVVAILVQFMIPTIYKSEATILPIEYNIKTNEDLFIYPSWLNNKCLTLTQ